MTRTMERPVHEYARQRIIKLMTKTVKSKAKLGRTKNAILCHTKARLLNRPAIFQLAENILEQFSNEQNTTFKLQMI